MEDKIVYLLVTRPGGMDGMDPNAKGGPFRAYWTRKEAEDDRNLPWCDIVPTVIDPDAVRSAALAKLTPVERLVIETLHPALPKFDGAPTRARPARW